MVFQGGASSLTVRGYQRLHRIHEHVTWSTAIDCGMFCPEEHSSQGQWEHLSLQAKAYTVQQRIGAEILTLITKASREGCPSFPCLSWGMFLAFGL